VARFAYSLLAVAFSSASTLAAQSFPSEDPVLKRLYSVGIDSSQVYELAQPLLDSIGPRLTGSPAIRSGNEWLVARYKEFGIAAKNEQYGTWRAWRRGITHFDLLSPRVRTLEAMMLAWSAPTKGKVEGKVIILPEVADSAAFRAWLPAAKGNFVLVSYPQPTCRPDSNFKQNALPATWDSLQATRKRAREEWTARVQRTGAQGGDALAIALADAGAAGVVTNLWSQGWGVDKIFGTRATKAPVVDVSCEDYGLLFRLAER
jgi:carboxypeptidase Q